MTLILEERAFANCPLLKRFGTTDTTRPGVLNISLPSGANIQKNAFSLPIVRNMYISSPVDITIAGSAGFNKLDVSIPTVTIDYDTVTDTVNHTITSTSNILISSTVINESANITLSATAGGNVRLNNLYNFVSLTLPAVPIYSILPYAAASKLESLTVPVTSSEEFTDIMKCTSLKNITLLSVYPSFKPNLFTNNTQLESITIGSLIIDTIEEFTFAGCSNLKKLQIGNVTDTLDVINIERGAFYRCAKLETIKFTDRLKKIGDVAFMDCGISGEVIIPKNVAEHGFAYFLRCNNLTKLTYLCNLIDFNDPTAVTFNNFAPFIAFKSNNLKLEMYGDITIIPGETVTPHRLTYLSKAITDTSRAVTVNTDLFEIKFNTSKFNERNELYKSIISNAYTMLDTVNNIDSILLGKSFIDFKNDPIKNDPKKNDTTSDISCNDALRIVTNISEVRENIEDFVDSMQESYSVAQQLCNKIALPTSLPSEMTTLSGLLNKVKVILTTNLTSVADIINPLIDVNLINVRNSIESTLSTLNTVNNNILVNGDTDAFTSYTIPMPQPIPISNNPTIEVEMNSTLINNFDGDTTIEVINGESYMKYSTLNIDISNDHIPGIELSDDTIYTVDGWIRFNMKDHYSSPHISAIKDILTIIRNGTYNNKDINYELIAPKIIIIDALKQYTGVNITITAPIIMINDNAMEEFTDSTITLNASANLNISSDAFKQCINTTFNIAAGGSIVCAKEIMANSSLITLNTNKELINIPATPIILNNTTTQHWNMNIKELLDTIKSTQGVDTSDAYNVEYTSFTATNSVNPIFAVSFITRANQKEYNVIIPPNDYYWAISVGKSSGNAYGCDFDFDGRKFLYYADADIRKRRKDTAFKLGYGAKITADMLTGSYGWQKSDANKDYYGLTNNFAPSSFTYKGYTFVQQEKVNNRDIRQVCSNNGEAISERYYNKVIGIIFMVLEIFSLVTIVIPVGAIAGAIVKNTAKLAYKAFMLTRVGLTISSHVTRVGRLIVKTADIMRNLISNSIVVRNVKSIIKAGKHKILTKITRKVNSCGRDPASCMRTLSRASSEKMAFNPTPSNLQKSGSIRVLYEVGDDGVEFAANQVSRTRSGNVVAMPQGLKAVKVVSPAKKPIKFTGSSNVEKVTTKPKPAVITVEVVSEAQKTTGKLRLAPRKQLKPVDPSSLIQRQAVVKRPSIPPPPAAPSTQVASSTPITSTPIRRYLPDATVLPPPTVPTVPAQPAAALPATRTTSSSSVVVANIYNPMHKGATAAKAASTVGRTAGTVAKGTRLVTRQLGRAVYSQQYKVRSVPWLWRSTAAVSAGAMALVIWLEIEKKKRESAAGRSAIEPMTTEERTIDRDSLQAAVRYKASEYINLYISSTEIANIYFDTYEIVANILNIEPWNNVNLIVTAFVENGIIFSSESTLFTNIMNAYFTTQTQDNPNETINCIKRFLINIIALRFTDELSLTERTIFKNKLDNYTLSSDEKINTIYNYDVMFDYIDIALFENITFFNSASIVNHIVTLFVENYIIKSSESTFVSEIMRLYFLFRYKRNEPINMRFIKTINYIKLLINMIETRSTDKLSLTNRKDITKELYIYGISFDETEVTNYDRISQYKGYLDMKNRRLIDNLTSIFTENGLSLSNSKNIVTALVYYIVEEDLSKKDDYKKQIYSVITDIINTDDSVSSDNAVSLLESISLLINTDTSAYDSQYQTIEEYAGDGKVFGPVINENGPNGFNEFGLKYIAMYNIMDKLYATGIPQTDETTGGVISVDADKILSVTTNIDNLLEDTMDYKMPPYINPLPYRNSNIRATADNYKDNLRSVHVGFNSETTVSYAVNETHKDKFDVIIEKARYVDIKRDGLIGVYLSNVKYIRIVSPTIKHWIPNINSINIDVREYDGPDLIEYCVEPQSWLTLDTYLTMGAGVQSDLYGDRDSYGHLNGTYTTANPLLLLDEYMWYSTKLRPIGSADNGDDSAALQFQHLKEYEKVDSVLSSLLPGSVSPHKSGIYMGWNSVKYAMADEEGTVMNTALGSISDLVINYVGATGTTIPAYAYSSCGLDSITGVDLFTVAGIALPPTVTSIGKKAFYRSGINYAIIPSNVKSIATQAFAEAGISSVLFVDSAKIKMIKGGTGRIGIGGSIPQYTDLYETSSYRGVTYYNRGDVMIKNPPYVKIGNITYSNVNFLLMLRAKIYNYVQGLSPFDRWDEGVVSAAAYILSGDISMITIEDGYYNNIISQLTIDNNTTITYNNIRSRDVGAVSNLEFIGGFSGTKSSALADIVIRKPVSLVIKGETFTSIDELRIMGASIFVFDYIDSSVVPFKSVTKITLFDYNTSRTSTFNPPTSGSISMIGTEYTIIPNSNRERSAPRAIEDSVDIGPNAFADNTSLDTLVFPQTIRNIGDNAYAGCTALTIAEFPPLKSIGKGVLAGCTSLTNVSFPADMESLGPDVLDNCTSLETISFNGALPDTIDPGFLGNIATLGNSITINVLPQYASSLINTLRNSGINLGSPSSNITLAVNNFNSTPYFPLLLSPSAARVKETLYVYSSETMESLKSGLAINPITKYVSWLASGTAYDGMMIKPLGRKVHIFTTGRRPMLKYVFLNIQLISTAIVPLPTDRQPYLTGWVCTWSADGVYPTL